MHFSGCFTTLYRKGKFIQNKTSAKPSGNFRKFRSLTPVKQDNGAVEFISQSYTVPSLTLYFSEEIIFPALIIRPLVGPSKRTYPQRCSFPQFLSPSLYLVPPLLNSSGPVPGRRFSNLCSRPCPRVSNILSPSLSPYQISHGFCPQPVPNKFWPRREFFVQLDELYH